MSPKPKHELAREHLARALNAIDAGDVVVAIIAGQIEAVVDRAEELA